MTQLEIELLDRSSQYIPTVSMLYAASFGEGNNESEGWGERAACWQPECLEEGKQKKIVPYVEVGTQCPDCLIPMSEAYPLDWTINYIISELSALNPIGFLGFVREEIVAVAWAYEDDISKIALEKYNSYRMQSLIPSLVQSRWPEAKKSRYISEVIVAPNWRGNFFATTLVQALIDYENDGNTPITMRTMQKSPMYGIGLRVGLEQVVGTTSLLPRDSEQPRRVFFVSPRII